MGRFNVVDLVRVREWDDMVRQFGISSDGHIMCSPWFTSGMRRFCGGVYKISRIDGGSCNLEGGHGYFFSEDSFFPAITYREYAEKVEPKRIDPGHFGGVKGCPFSLPGIYTHQPDFCSFPNYDDDICRRCWGRYLTEEEYKEYEKRKKEEKKEMEFKKGDYVKVFKKGSASGVIWVDGMDWTVGKVFKISETCAGDYCRLEGAGRFWFPFKNLRKTMPKDILTPFCTVKLRDGDVGVFDGKDRILLKRGFIRVSERGDDLKGVCERDIDVIDICLPSPAITRFEGILENRGECIWKREEVVEITAEEAAKKLKDQYGGAEVKIVV